MALSVHKLRLSLLAKLIICVVRDLLTASLAVMLLHSVVQCYKQFPYWVDQNLHLLGLGTPPALTLLSFVYEDSR